jgi:LPXTG-motif cell wall-anchored protein
MGGNAATEAAVKMTNCHVSLLIIGITLLGAGALFIFYKKSKSGYGPFNTGTLILILVLTLAPLLAIAQVIDGRDIASIFLAVAGFAGGLFVNGHRQVKTPQTQRPPTSDPSQPASVK